MDSTERFDDSKDTFSQNPPTVGGTERIDDLGEAKPESTSTLSKTERVLGVPDILSPTTPTGTIRNVSLDESFNGITPDAPVSSISEVKLGETIYLINHLLARSGEAEVYLVENEQKKYVWKLYHQDFKPKQSIIDSLKDIKRPDIMHMLYYGEYNGRFFELNEYLAGGTLDELKPINKPDVLREIIRQVNEALHFCHQQRIIHRDIKPQNIFFRDTTHQEVVLGDFGISSQLDEGASSRVTTRARTSLYAAPELFTEIKGKTSLGVEVDYYALGVTILEVWNNENPFGNNMEHDMMRAKTGALVLFPKDMPTDFIQLAKGLLTPTYPDRWGFDQVSAWVRKEPNIPLKFNPIFDYKRYPVGKLLGQVKESYIDSPEKMGEFIEKYPEIGINELLYNNKISNWLLAAGDIEVGNMISDVVEKDYPRDKKAGLMEAIFILNPERTLLGHDGKTKLEEFRDIATYFEQNAQHYQNSLKYFTDDFYAFIMSLGIQLREDEQTGEVIKLDYKAKAKKYHSLFSEPNYTAEKALNTIILDLQAGELLLGPSNFPFTRLSDLISVPNLDFQDYVLKQCQDSDSKTSVWLETNNPELIGSLVNWRSQKRFSTSTLGYALQIQGYQLEGKTANSKDSFIELFAANQASYFNHPNATFNQEEADYWLKNYHNSTLSEVLLDCLHARLINKQYINSVIRYLLQTEQANLYEIIENSLKAALSTYLDDQSYYSEELITTLTEFYAEKIHDSKIPAKTVTHLDSYTALTEHLAKLDPLYQLVKTQVMQALNSTIEEGIRQDFEIAKASDKVFKKYFKMANYFVTSTLTSTYPEMPLVKHWIEKQNKFEAKVGSSIEKIDALKKGKLAENQKTFRPIFRKTRKETQVFCESEMVMNYLKLQGYQFSQQIADSYYKRRSILFLLLWGVLTLTVPGILFYFLSTFTTNNNYVDTNWFALPLVAAIVIPIWNFFDVSIKPAFIAKLIGRWAYAPIIEAQAQEKIDNKADTPYRKTEIAFQKNITDINNYFNDQLDMETLDVKKDIYCAATNNL